MKQNRSKKQLSKQEIASFCDQMAMIIKAGITPKDGLELMLTDTKDEATRAVLEELLKYSRLGEPFSTCVKSSEYFPNYVINMIALGEETGQLDDVLVALCHYYEHEEYISENLRSAVTYPVVMIIMMLFNRFECFRRVVGRYRRFRNKTRPDIAEGCTEKLDKEFITWVLWRGRSRGRRRIYKDLAEKYSGKVTVLKNQRQLDEFRKGIADGSCFR